MVVFFHLFWEKEAPHAGSFSRITKSHFIDTLQDHQRMSPQYTYVENNPQNHAQKLHTLTVSTFPDLWFRVTYFQSPESRRNLGPRSASCREREREPSTKSLTIRWSYLCSVFFERVVSICHPNTHKMSTATFAPTMERFCMIAAIRCGSFQPLETLALDAHDVPLRILAVFLRSWSDSVKYLDYDQAL